MHAWTIRRKSVASQLSDLPGSAPEVLYISDRVLGEEIFTHQNKNCNYNNVIGFAIWCKLCFLFISNLLILILESITLIQFVSRLPELPHFRHHFSYLPVICWIAFQNMWPSSHSFSILYLRWFSLFTFYLDHLIHACIKSYFVTFYF